MKNRCLRSRESHTQVSEKYSTTDACGETCIKKTNLSFSLTKPTQPGKHARKQALGKGQKRSPPTHTRTRTHSDLSLTTTKNTSATFITSRINFVSGEKRSSIHKLEKALKILHFYITSEATGGTDLKMPFICWHRELVPYQRSVLSQSTRLPYC